MSSKKKKPEPAGVVQPRAVARSSVMNPVTWQHPYGSAWFETAALIFCISQRNAERERVQFPVKPLKQTPSSNVIMVVLESKS
jgi:hypothetical protein